MREYQRETISKIVSLINKNILLPDIQRSFVWKEDQIYKLFDSLMRGYPISTFLFWSLTKEDLEKIQKEIKINIRMYKFVDSNDKDSDEELNRARDDYKLVLDGQQRLTSLFIALKGCWKQSYRGKRLTKELYFDLLSGQKEDEDGILYDFLFLDGSNDIVKLEQNGDGDSPSKIWVNVKKVYESDIGEAKKRRIFIDDLIKKNSSLADYREQIDDNIDRFNDVLKDDGIVNYFPEDETNYEKVLDIFVRTNSGGTKLSYSDLLFSTIKSRWYDARDNFKDLIESINRGNIEFDTDFVLKTCLVIFSKKAEEIHYNVNNLSDTFIKDVRDNWEKIANAMKLTADLLGNFLIKDKKLLPSFNALIPIIYWIYKKDKNVYRSDSEQDYQELLVLRVWLIKALLSGVFGAQIDTVLAKCKEAVDGSKSIIFPAQEIQNNFTTLKNKSMEIDAEKFDKFAYRSKESHLFLALCYKMAVNFNPIMNGSLPEQDHILSVDELSKANVPAERINSIYNIRYVLQTDNRKKSNTPFLDWVKDLDQRKDDVFETHFIPDFSPEKPWTPDNFDDFLKARKALMVSKIEY